MEMTTLEFMSIGVVGTATSLLIDFIRTTAGYDSTKARALSLCVSVIMGALVWALQTNAVLWQTTIGILMTATTVYNLVIKPVKESKK